MDLPAIVRSQRRGQRRREGQLMILLLVLWILLLVLWILLLMLILLISLSISWLSTLLLVFLLMAFLSLSRHAVEIGEIDVGETRKGGRLGVAKYWVGWVNGVGGAARGGRVD